MRGLRRAGFVLLCLVLLGGAAWVLGAR
ncbi:MAG: hypothetical protein JWL60_1701, partial [Gemmatimonadetes bacterium]|nr:hypothetical protein [Gemmatimonadota bacterium]